MLLGQVDELADYIVQAMSLDDLQETLIRSCHEIGFDCFALAVEFGWGGEQGGSALVHNYPATWADVYTGFNLAASDPVRRAAERSLLAFRWDTIDQLIPITGAESAMFEIGRRHGLVDGFTVPRHIPGAITGTCTFVIGSDRQLPAHNLFVADALGALAIARASHLAGSVPKPLRARLTDRQRDCVLWAARGKTDWEISRILGISHETVIQHLKDARDRYDTHKRASLILHALFDGLICFADIFRWRERQ